MDDSLLVELVGALDLVGFDASDVEGLFDGQKLHQAGHRVLEDGPRRLRPFRRLGDGVGALGPHGSVGREGTGN